MERYKDCYEFAYHVAAQMRTFKQECKDDETKTFETYLREQNLPEDMIQGYVKMYNIISFIDEE